MVKLTLSRKVRRAFTKKRATLELRILASDAAGNRVQVVRRVTVR